jgi:phosphohistidine phosphatase
MASNVELYLIRHGIAANRGDEYPDDTKRPLTARGMARVKKQTAALAKLGVRIDLVLTSPLVRTRQTAEIVAAGLPSKPSITNTDALAPGGSYNMVIDELSKYARRSHIALVGHEPGIGELAGRLIGSRTPIPFRKGAVCRIDVDALPPASRGLLRWFLTPKMLRRLGK